jgi:hypothetical protein
MGSLISKAGSRILLSIFMMVAAGLFSGRQQVCASDGSYYVDPIKGSDDNPGTLSAPWKTLAAGIPKLKPGNTLYLRGGVYWEGNIEIGLQGTPTSPITIKNHSGEKPVIDGGFKEFRNIRNSDWEVADSSKRIYRSVKTYPDVGLAFGYFESNGKYYSLVPYEDYRHLATDNEYYVENGDIYVGPGVHWKEGRIYVRLKPSQLGTSMGYGNILPTEDPKGVKLYIFPDTQVIRFNRAAYVNIEGIDIRHQANALEFQTGSHNIAIRNCDLRGGRTHVMIRDGVHDLVFKGVTIRDAVPDWVAWTDVKIHPKPAHSLQGSAFSIKGSSFRIEIADSTIESTWDGIDMVGSPHDISVHHNTFRGVRDDCLQIGSAGYDIEIDHNMLLHVSKGPSGQVSGTPGKIGAKYIHHNVIDCSKLMQYTRKMSDGSWFDNGKRITQDGKGWARPFGSHGGKKETIVDPWKIYNNTLKFGNDLNGKGGGQVYKFAADRGHPHEVYNNIFIQISDDWVAARAEVADGSQIYDGNIYYRTVSHPTSPLFRKWESGRKKEDFQSLAAFKSSRFFQETRAYYPKGWESSGVEADPALDGQYRPSPHGPAANGAVTLPAGFPGNDGGRYRGALPPVTDKKLSRSQVTR